MKHYAPCGLGHAAALPASPSGTLMRCRQFYRSSSYNTAYYTRPYPYTGFNYLASASVFSPSFPSRSGVFHRGAQAHPSVLLPPFYLDYAIAALSPRSCQQGSGTGGWAHISPFGYPPYHTQACPWQLNMSQGEIELFDVNDFDQN